MTLGADVGRRAQRLTQSLAKVPQMETTNIARELASLPPEAQREVLDFVAFLKARYSTRTLGRKTNRTRLADEPFVGMWRSRAEMRDSVAWVRELRQREWDTAG